MDKYYAIQYTLTPYRWLDRSVPYLIFSGYLSPEDILKMGFNTFIYRYIGRVTQTGYRKSSNKKVEYLRNTTVLYFPHESIVREYITRPNAYKFFVNGQYYPVTKICDNCKEGLKCRFNDKPFAFEDTYEKRCKLPITFNYQGLSNETPAVKAAEAS